MARSGRHGAFVAAPQAGFEPVRVFVQLQPQDALRPPAVARQGSVARRIPPAVRGAGMPKPPVRLEVHQPSRPRDVEPPRWCFVEERHFCEPEIVEYVERRGAQAVVRGLRAVSDFEFEFQLALMNRKLNERIETIFMMPKDTYTFLSSRIVKEIARLGGDVSSFVPAHVRTALIEKLGPVPA